MTIAKDTGSLYQPLQYILLKFLYIFKKAVFSMKNPGHQETFTTTTTHTKTLLNINPYLFNHRE